MWINENDHVMADDDLFRGWDFDEFIMTLCCNYTEEYLNKHGDWAIRETMSQLMEKSRNDCAFRLEKYKEEILSLAKPDCRKPVLDGEVKTLQGWLDSSKGDFDKYVKEGDKVALDIVDHFINCLPPKRWNNGYFQMGEPQSSAHEGETYMTFIYLYNDSDYKEVWKYCGNCLTGTTEHGTPIQYV